MIKRKLQRLKEKPAKVIALAGDSGDGIQLLGKKIAEASALNGFQLMSRADFPAEIRAPKGTEAGVSGYNLFIQNDANTHTSGSQVVDLLFATNPAALQSRWDTIGSETVVVIDENQFTKKTFKKADFDLERLTELREAGNLLELPLTNTHKDSFEGHQADFQMVTRARNFYYLGAICNQLGLDVLPLIQVLQKKESQTSQDSINLLSLRFAVPQSCGNDLAKKDGAHDASGNASEDCFRLINGNEAISLGLIAASEKSGRGLFYSSYPITPASEILHQIAAAADQSWITSHQAEDEIAAIGAAIGASFGGFVGATGTSGPGLSLKSEFLGLAVMSELPLVVIDVQRAGPSTGMPTKAAQGDLLQAIYGRHGDSPIVVLAAKSPSDCFQTTYEAVSIAIKHMTPVIVLSDASLAYSSEVWKVPSSLSLPEIGDSTPEDIGDLKPYSRIDDSLARPWWSPGDPEHIHCIGGLEKQPESGLVTSGAEEHLQMTFERREKILKVAEDYPPTEVFGERSCDTLLLTWGSTFGAAREATEKAVSEGLSVSHVHLRFLNPLPLDLQEICSRYKQILIPELNDGQFYHFLKSKIDASFHSVPILTGRPADSEGIYQLLFEKGLKS